MKDIYDWLIAEYQTNEFLVGMTVPFLIGAALYASRTLLKNIYGALQRRFTVSMSINSDLYKYPLMSSYLFNRHIVNAFSRNVSLVQTSRSGTEDTLEKSAGYGTHLIRRGSIFGLLKKTKEENSQSEIFKEIVTVTFFTTSPNKLLDELVRELQHVLNSSMKPNILEVHKTNDYGYDFLLEKPHRSFDTLQVRPELIPRIQNHIEDFLSSEDEYLANGKPWHTGILIHGQPGKGKSSLIHCLASWMNRDIVLHYKGNLTGKIDKPRSHLLVLEDIDASGISTTRDSDTGSMQKSDTMSEVLNFLDGFMTPHGLITVATTNHLDRLDPALVRPGRFDLTIDMDAESLYRSSNK